MLATSTKLSELVDCSLGRGQLIFGVEANHFIITVHKFLLKLEVRRPFSLVVHVDVGLHVLVCVLKRLLLLFTHLQENSLSFLSRSVLLLHEILLEQKFVFVSIRFINDYGRAGISWVVHGTFCLNKGLLTRTMLPLVVIQFVLSLI